MQLIHSETLPLQKQFKMYFNSFLKKLYSFASKQYLTQNIRIMKRFHII